MKSFLEAIIVALVILFGGVVALYMFLGVNTVNGYIGIVQFCTGTKPDGGFLLFIDNFSKYIITITHGAI